MNVRRWVFGAVIGLGALLFIFVRGSERPPVEARVLYRTNDLFLGQVVVLTITNRSNRSFSFVASTETMEEAAWRGYGYTEVPRLLRAAESQRLDVRVPYLTSRWLEIPMRIDASPVPWRIKLVYTRDLGQTERMLARAFKKLGFRYPFSRSSQQYLEFAP